MMNDFVESVLCDDVTLPPAGSRIIYTYISGGDYPNYEKSQVSSFLSSGDEADVIRAVNSLRIQADFDWHYFIEAFAKDADGSYEVVLGS